MDEYTVQELKHRIQKLEKQVDELYEVIDELIYQQIDIKKELGINFEEDKREIEIQEDEDEDTAQKAKEKIDLEETIEHLKFYYHWHGDNKHDS